MLGLKFDEMVRLAPHIHYTCYVLVDGTFKQWHPKTRALNVEDQLGYDLRKIKANVLEKEVFSFQPTAYNYMNVRLY